MTPPSRKPVAALLIHGLGGTEFDLGALHKILRGCGVDTHAVTLPGHGTVPDDLRGVPAEAWMTAVTDRYRELVARYRVVHVIGMCMGALLALELAKRERHSCGKLVVLAPPIFLDGWSTPWYRGLRHLLYRTGPLVERMRVTEAPPFGIKNELVRRIVMAKFERGDAFHYPWVPLQCVRQVDRLRTWVKRDLSHIPCPTLVVHAREDELTSLRSAYFVQAALAPGQVKLVILENSYHMICVDNDRDELALNVAAHLELDTSAVARRRRDGSIRLG